jgi:hypothetical protein
MERDTCPLASWGCSRDGKKGKTQIEYGLTTDKGGCPEAYSELRCQLAPDVRADALQDVPCDN